jgi:hypothetical protein
MYQSLGEGIKMGDTTEEEYGACPAIPRSAALMDDNGYSLTCSNRLCIYFHRHRRRIDVSYGIFVRPFAHMLGGLP